MLVTSGKVITLLENCSADTEAVLVDNHDHKSEARSFH